MRRTVQQILDCLAANRQLLNELEAAAERYVEESAEEFTAQNRDLLKRIMCADIPDDLKEHPILYSITADFFYKTNVFHAPVSFFPSRGTIAYFIGGDDKERAHV